jgi:elongin-A
MQDDRELWLDFIKRDIPQWEQYDIPPESDCWYDIYCDLLDQVQREVEEGALQLKQAVDKFYSDKASNAAVLVKDSSRLPKPRRRFQPTTSGTRSEPKKKGIFSSKRNKVLAVPTHQLHSGASRINHVPQWLVDEHKQAPPSTPATPAARPVSKSATAGGQVQKSSGPLVSAPRRPIISRPALSVSATSGAKSDKPPGTRPIVPGKRTLDRSPSRIQSGRAESAGSPPVRQSPISPAKPLVRKRPAASQPNIFIQQKKRRT